MIRNVRWLLVLLVLFGLENVTAAVRPLLPNRSSKIELRIAAPMLQSLHRTFDGVLHYPTGLLAFDDLLCEYEIVEVHPLFTHDPVSLRNPIFFQVGMDRFFELTCDAFVTLSESERETLLGRLRSIEGIELANFIGLCGPLFTPNDFSLEGRELWGLDTMHCRQAWDLQKGNDEILVATIDTGIDYVHEDLRDNIAINPGEDIDQDGQLSTADNNVSMTMTMALSTT
ncbi:MAG: hypothetical protein OEM52_13260 [bacterium]|nr:hypothetical protein [bacterium]